jgi:hypothetical protein
MMFYALYRYQRGTETTRNGKWLDSLHRFDTKSKRDAFVAAHANAAAISKREADKLSRYHYKIGVGKLEPIGHFTFGENDATLTRLIVIPQ